MAGTDLKSARDEKEIIARILGGDRDLFHELIRPYERAVYLTVYPMLKNEEEAEDATQEAMLKAYRNLKSFRAEAKFSTWLISIALNEARSRLRKAKRAPMESLDQEQEGPEGDFTPMLLRDWREIPLEALERKEMQQMLRAAVGDLPKIYREVFILRDLQEMDVQQTAEVTGVTANVVKVRLHRARMMLQKQLTPKLKRSVPARKGLLGRWL